MMMSHLFEDYLKGCNISVSTEYSKCSKYSKYALASSETVMTTFTCASVITPHLPNKDNEVKAKDTGGGWSFFSRPKLELRAFIAQMATGEGMVALVLSLLYSLCSVYSLYLRLLFH